MKIIYSIIYEFFKNLDNLESVSMGCQKGTHTFKAKRKNN